jgi:multidrug resistance efflux pump
MNRTKLRTMVTTVALCLCAVATAQTLPVAVPDQAALAAEVASLTQRLADAQTAEAQGQVSHGDVVDLERKLVQAQMQLAQAAGKATDIPGILQRKVALEQGEVKRLEALQGSGSTSGAALAKALERLVSAKTELAQSREETADVKADLERLVTLREAELARVKGAAERGLVSGSRVDSAEAQLADAKAKLEEALKPPPEPELDDEGALPDVPDLPNP